MDVADKISQVPTHDVGPYPCRQKPVVILSAKVLPPKHACAERAARVFSQRNLKLLLAYTCGQAQQTYSGRPVKKLTDKQRVRFWEQRRNVNFNKAAVSKGIRIPLVASDRR